MLKDRCTIESKVNNPRTSNLHISKAYKTVAPPAGRDSTQEQAPRTPQRNGIRETSKPQDTNAAHFGLPTPLTGGKVGGPWTTTMAGRQQEPHPMMPDPDQASTTNKEAMAITLADTAEVAEGTVAVMETTATEARSRTPREWQPPRQPQLHARSRTPHGQSGSSC